MIAAALQFFATPFARDHNLETAERLIRQAAGQGAQIVVLPELFNTGYIYSPKLFAAAEAEAGPTTIWLSGLSRELGALIGGTILRREGGRLFNTFVLAAPDGALHHYRKQNLFLWERCYFEPGRAPLIVETPLGRLGLMICWDIARPAIWESYRGQMDALLLASAPPRLHRAVLNFPLGKKVYLAELLPALLREREALDEVYGADLGQRAAWLGAPIVSSVMAGRFVAQVPLPRLSFLLASLVKPRFWSWIPKSPLASLRATFFGSSAIYDPARGALARAEGDEGLALAELNPSTTPRDGPLPQPPSLALFDLLLRPFASAYYRDNLRSTFSIQQ